ncbi:phage tail protein [Methylobacterium sp. WL120]|uniref:phage tail protein n=1 Tax=Methylobacterium sp. WL120 TaxID=2603887 RepID=UPI0011C71E38|nr:phage tail protein [Methylobacterium sp. WL120]TXM68302.1 phage tail protein [Methylobacterium sp. WL120]
MNQNLMSLGEHYFFSPRPGEASPGFQTIERDMSFTWASQPRLSRSPAMQFTGPGADTIQVEGKLFPHLFGGLKTLDALRETGEAGKQLMLARYYVLSNPTQYVGERIGKFVMTRLRRRELKIGGDGLPMYMEFSLELQKYGDDPAEEFSFT